jgi:hypothetical protein
MLRRLAAAAAVASAVVPAMLVTAARAQDLSAICERAIHPSVGAWSEFRMTGGRQEGSSFRMAVVGKESRDGTPYVWIEAEIHGIVMGPGSGHPITVITKALVPDLDHGMGQARERIMKIGDQPAMEMPASQSHVAPTPGSDILSGCRSAKVIGWERVTVPAGTFRALHVQDARGNGDTWVDPDLPLAVVKGTSHGGQSSMELTAHGSGARTRITGKPRPWDPMAFRQMMMGAAQGQ